MGEVGEVGREQHEQGVGAGAIPAAAVPPDTHMERALSRANPLPVSRCRPLFATEPG